MITTKELLKWRDRATKANEQAKKELEDYKRFIFGGNLAGYYEHLMHISSAQIDIINRLIAQSIENDKEQVWQ